MKKLLLPFFLGFLFSFFLQINANAQDWNPAYDSFSSTVDGAKSIAINPINKTFYVGGYFNQVGGIPNTKGIAQRDSNGVWSSVGGGVNGPWGEVRCLEFYQGKLYAGGNFDSIGGIIPGRIACWDGTNWSSLNGGVNGWEVDALCVYDGYLVVGGGFSVAGGIWVDDVAKWNGSNWFPIGITPGSYIGGLVRDIEADTINNLLYIGGWFSEIYGIPANNVAVWDGTNWNYLSTGITGFVTEITVYNNNLYAAGSFNQAGGISANSIAVWNGSGWDSLASGLLDWVGDPAVVFGMEYFLGEIYVGGIIVTAGGTQVNSVAAWDGTIWKSIGSGFSASAMCDDFYSFGNDSIYSLGSSGFSGSTWINGLAKWPPSSSPLPLKLLSFTGENKGDINVLKWETASEVDIDYYLIEKSNDGISFEELDKVPASGYSNFNTYQLVDDNPKEGITYYRLTEISFDGKRGYSDIVAVEKKSSGLNIEISPNIVENQFIVTISSLEENLLLQIYNSVGQKAKAFDITEKITVIPRDNLPAGIYFYQIGKETGKLIFR